METQSKPAILLVDDIAENIILLEHQLQHLDIHIISATSGVDALQKTEGIDPFLALIDVKMPGMDGIELAGFLQKKSEMGMLPVIFITAYAESEILDKCYEVGAVDFISKPFKRNILVSKVKIFLELYRHKQELLENQRKLEISAKELERINRSLDASRRELSELTVHLEEVREDERRRIALDLHDDLGQKLTALSMDIAWMRKNLNPLPDNVLLKLESMKSLLSETIKTVRKLSFDLRPSSLDDLGLISTLNWHFQEYEKNTNIRVVKSLLPEETEFEPQLSILIFRVVQEALTNVARHSKASEVHVKLSRSKGKIHLDIVDNGIGIDAGRSANPHSFGIFGIKERVRAWGGSLEISGEPKVGTRLSFKLPLTKTGS